MLSKRETSMLRKESKDSLMFYRFVCAAAPAALFMVVVCVGFAILGG